MFMAPGMINAIYALYGRPEPGPNVSTTQIAQELNEMAKERRQADMNKAETKSFEEKMKDALH